MTYPQGLSAGHGEPTDGSFTIIFRQDITIRQRIFLAVPSVWMDRKRELVYGCFPKKTPRHSKCGGEWRRVVKEKKVTTRVAL